MDQSCETKKGDNLNWRTWSAMGVLKGATAVFSCQGGGAERGDEERLVCLVGLRVLRMCVSERVRSLLNRREG